MKETNLTKQEFAEHQSKTRKKERQHCKTEPVLEEESRLTQSCLELCSDAIFVTDATLKIVLANEAAVELSEYPHDELIGAPLASLLSSQKRLLRKNNTPLDVIVSERSLNDRYRSHVIHPVSGRSVFNPKKNEPDLRLSQFAMDHVMDAVLWLRSDGSLVYANEAACHALGYACKDLLRLNIRDIDPSLREKNNWRKLWKRSSKQKRIHFDSVHQKKDGKAFPVEVVFHYLNYENEKYICVFARDMSVQQDSQRVLELAEKKYKDLVENVKDVIYSINIDGVVTYISPAVEQMSRYKPEEILGRRFIEFIHPEDREGIMRNFEGKTNVAVNQLEHRISTKSGTTRWVRSSSQIIYSDGKFVGIQGVLTDITEARKAETALRESEEKYRTLFEESRDMIYINTAEGDVIDVNQAASDVLGYSKEELLQMNVKELYVDLKQREQFQTEIKRKGAVKDFEVNLFAKDGSIKTCLITSSARHDKDGNLLGYHGIVRDVTQEKQLQEELQRAYRLESAGKLAGQIAHDFNNLLSPLAAYPALIREELPDEHAAHSLLDEMEFTANKIAEINQQLLTLGRRGHYNLEPIDLNELVHQVVMTQQLSESIKVKEELASGLFVIKGGEAQLTRALINLVNNAAEAMNGRGTLYLKTKNVYLDVPLVGYKTINRGEYVCLSVADTGNGIAHEIIDRIFDPFFTTKTMDRQRGSGLGLSVVHSIVEDNQGYITVDSTEQGTTFSLYFPVAREYEKYSKEGHTEIKQGYEQVLIVDDDPMQRKVLSQLLQRFGYQVDAVSSGEEAVEYVRCHHPDLLLLDMVMDGIDGTETYRQILEFKPAQKAILLSGYAMSERVRQALSLGAGSFISKPIIPHTLTRTVRSVLNK